MLPFDKLMASHFDRGYSEQFNKFTVAPDELLNAELPALTKLKKHIKKLSKGTPLEWENLQLIPKVSHWDNLPFILHK